MRLTVRSPSFIRQFLDHRREPKGHARHAHVVELLGRVARQMVMGIAVEGRVRHHDRRVAVLAKRPVIRPRYAGHACGRGYTFRWKPEMGAKCRDGSPYERSRAEIADEGDEVRAVRI